MAKIARSLDGNKYWKLSPKGEWVEIPKWSPTWLLQSRWPSPGQMLDTDNGETFVINPNTGDWDKVVGATPTLTSFPTPTPTATTTPPTTPTTETLPPLTGPGGMPYEKWAAMSTPKVDPGWMEEEPAAAFMRRYNLPGYGLTPAQRYISRQAAPMSATWQAYSALNPTAEGGFSWADWLQNQPLATTGAKASQAFGQALKLPELEQRGFREVIGDETFNQWLNAVLAQHYAGPVAQRMAARIPSLENQFTARQQGQGGDFLNWLAQKFGIGGFGSP